MKRTSPSTASRRSSRFDQEKIRVEASMQKPSSQGSTSLVAPYPQRRSTRSSGGQGLEEAPPLPPQRRPRRLDKGKGRAITPVREPSHPYTPAQDSPSSEWTHENSPEWRSPSLPPHPSPPFEGFIELTPPPPFQRTATPSPAPSSIHASGNNNAYPIPDSISVRVNFRCGERHTQPRARKTLPQPVVWDYKWNCDNIDVLCSRIKGITNGLPRFKWPDDSQLYLKPNHHAGQDNYKALDEETCDLKLKLAWKNEARRQKSSEGIVTDLFVYLADTGAGVGTNGRTGGPSVGTGEVFRRATMLRTKAATARLNKEIQEGHMEQVGGMEETYLGTHFARREPVPENERIILPNTSRAFQQIRTLDAESEIHNRRTEADNIARQQLFKTVRVRVGTVVFPIEVHVVDFKNVLELPDMNLNGLPNFRARDESDELEGPAVDMPDEDHA